MFKWLAERKGPFGRPIYAKGALEFTSNASEAKKFDTQTECQAWIDANFTISDGFVAIEHGFMV